MPGPVAQWVPASETRTSSTVIAVLAIVLLVVVVLPLISIIALIFLGGRVSEILSSIGTSV